MLEASARARPLARVDAPVARDPLAASDLDSAGSERDLRAALHAEPNRLDLLLRLAAAMLARREPSAAQLLLSRACRLAPACVLAWDMLAQAFIDSGDFDDAEAALDTAARVAPVAIELAFRRVCLALASGTAPAELARLEAVCRADPFDIIALTARGTLLERLGRREEAIEILEAAAALAPDLPQTAIELANALIHSDQTAAAESALRRAIDLAPEQWLLRNNHAVILMRMQRYPEARVALEDLIATRGEQTGLLTNLSTVLVALGEQDLGVAAARRATELAPTAHLGWRALANALCYQDGVDGAMMRDACVAAAACIVRQSRPPFDIPRDPDRRLRVGLLSVLLKTHPVGWLTIAGFENLDPAAFEIVCFAQAETGDPLTRRFRAIASAWHMAGAPDAIALADRVRAENIDVLIDLSGYGDRGLMAACAHRAAPVQIKWVGMQSHGTGLPEMDWFITDRFETPDGFEPLYVERLLRLPDGYVCYSPPTYAPAVVEAPCVARGAVTFGCFNNLAKITPRVVATWARILALVPGARMVLKTHQFDDPDCRARILGLFARAGIGADRIVLRGRSVHRALLAEYGDVDIVLDPFPYTGGLTTCEALWMGVPTITLAGEIFSARHATSHMSNVGLSDWVATDLEGYVAMAVERAGDTAALATLRSGMRARVRASPLCDGPRFGRNLGAALRGTWRAYCVA
jgi:predicted O-linked N-acetylglucosamine transferase (SPINDLY family)